MRRAASQLLCCCHVFVVGQVRCRVSGRGRVVSGVGRQTLKVWDVATGECVATLEGHSANVRCGVNCTFVMTCLRRRSLAVPCFRTGGASFWVGRRDAQGVGRGDRQVRGDAGRALELRAARRPLYFVMMCLRRRSFALRCFGRAARRVCVVRQHAQGVGRGDRRMRGDAGRALEERALRRPLYFCDDVSSS